MSEVYRISMAINLGGNITPEMRRLLKTLQQVDKEVNSVQKGLSKWKDPLERAVASAAKLKRSLSHVTLSGSPLERDMLKWTHGIQRTHAQMSSLGRATQSVGSAARGVTQSISVWANRIQAANSAMRQLAATMGNVRRTAGAVTIAQHGGGPQIAPHVAPTLRRGQRGHGGEGGAIGTAIGLDYLTDAMDHGVKHGAGRIREDIRTKNAGFTPEQNAQGFELARQQSAIFPSLGITNIREGLRQLVPNMDGDFEAAKKTLPSYLKTQVALQTSANPDGAENSTEKLAKAIDILGYSRDQGATDKLLSDWTRAMRLDPVAITPDGILQAVTYAAGAGKALSLDYLGLTMPSLIGQASGNKTGTGIASAFANMTLGRGTEESLLHQRSSGWRPDMETKTKKNGKQTIIRKGSLIDEPLYNQDPQEWHKKHSVPLMVKQGMLPKGWDQGDFSGEVTPEMRSRSTKFLNDRFSNRMGGNNANYYTIDLPQLEAFKKKARNAPGFETVFQDQKADPHVAWKGTKESSANLSAAISVESVRDLTVALNGLNERIAGATNWFEKNPTAGQTLFGTGAAVGGGLVLAGATSLLLAAGAALSIPALAIGAGAAVTIAALTIPWAKLYDAAPAPVRSALDHAGSGMRTAAEVEGGFLEAELREQAKRRARGTAGLGITPENTRAAVDRLGTTAGPGAQSQAQGVLDDASRAAEELRKAALRVHPPMLDASAGFNKVSETARSVPGALDGAANAMASFAARAASAFSNLGTAAPPPKPGTAPAGGTTGGGTAPSAAPRPQSYAPPPRPQGGGGGTTVVQMDGRTVGRIVERHIVARHEHRTGPEHFDGNTLMTPVGYSGSVGA